MHLSDKPPLKTCTTQFHFCITHMCDRFILLIYFRMCLPVLTGLAILQVSLSYLAFYSWWDSKTLVRHISRPFSSSQSVLCWTECYWLREFLVVLWPEVPSISSRCLSQILAWLILHVPLEPLLEFLSLFPKSFICWAHRSQIKPEVSPIYDRPRCLRLMKKTIYECWPVSSFSFILMKTCEWHLAGWPKNYFQMRCVMLQLSLQHVWNTFYLCDNGDSDLVLGRDRHFF